MKSKEQRHADVADALNKLYGLGFSTEMQGFMTFVQIVTDFVDKGVSASGDIAVEGTKRRIVYKLSLQNHIKSIIFLQHDANV